MIDLLDLHKTFILRHLGAGDTAVDFTMGNGHDTAFLSRTVGERGHVYAFDIQEAAVRSTAALLEQEGCPQNYTLIHDSHHHVAEYVRAVGSGRDSEHCGLPRARGGGRGGQNDYGISFRHQPAQNLCHRGTHSELSYLALFHHGRDKTVT